VPAAEHTYSYLAPSAVVEDERARSTLERLGAEVSRSSKLGKATAALL
jgi:hypothetical protein